jgi:hypothetical protein
MQIDQNLVFRKAVVPWYDSDTACTITAACMVVVLLFAVHGIYLARQLSEYRGYQWVPMLLAALSLTVLVSTLIRLIVRRYSER